MRGLRQHAAQQVRRREPIDPGQPARHRRAQPRRARGGPRRQRFAGRRRGRGRPAPPQGPARARQAPRPTGARCATAGTPRPGCSTAGRRDTAAARRRPALRPRRRSRAPCRRRSTRRAARAPSRTRDGCRATEQDGDVRRLRRPARAGQPIANGRAPDQPGDFGADPLGRVGDALADDDAKTGLASSVGGWFDSRQRSQAKPAAGLAIDSTRSTPPGRRLARGGRHRAASTRAETDRSRRSGTGPARSGAFSIGAEHIVHERRESRGAGAKADRNRPPRIVLLAQAGDERRRLVEHRDVGVAESVDRLLPVADDEDRRLDGVGGGAEALAPVAHQLRDQLPLRAAGVLELVDEHVAIARLEPEPALRELVHVLQQLHRSLEHAREVEQRVAFERALVLARARPRRSARRRATARRSDRAGTRAALRRSTGAMPPRRSDAASRLRRTRSRAAVKPVPANFSPRGCAVSLEEVARAADRPARGTRPALRARSNDGVRPRSRSSRRMSSASIANAGMRAVHRARNALEPARHAVRTPLDRRWPPSAGRPPRPSGRAGRSRGSAAAPAARRDADRAARPARCAAAARPAARTPAPRRRRRGRSRGRCAAPCRAIRRSGAAASVSSARSKPGSTSASSGNSRSSDRQNASIVEIAMSPSRSFSSRQRPASNCDSRPPRAAAR